MVGVVVVVKTEEERERENAARVELNQLSIWIIAPRPKKHV